MKKAMYCFGTIALAALLLSGCGVYNTVSVTQADGVDFKKSFHSFRWLPDLSDTVNTAYDNEIIRGNIRHALTTELAARNIRPAIDDASADLSLQLVIQHHGRLQDNVRFSPGFYFGPFGGSYSNNRSYVEHSRLTLNMYDNKAGKLVWTCTAEGDLNRSGDLSKNIRPAVEKIMKKYPVQAKQQPA